MIQLYECPNCGQDSAAFVTIKRPALMGTAINDIRCPACSPTPGTEPHDYRPVMLGGVVVEPDPRNDQRPDVVYVIDEVHAISEADWLATKNLISGFCCGDAGDCGHECGIG